MNALPLQRRSHYRLPVSLEIVWAPFESDAPISSVAFTADLSEDGTLVYSFEGEPPAVGDWLILEIPIPGRLPVLVSGQVLRYSEVNRQEKWATAIKFHGIEQRDRDRIFAYIMREQRKQLSSHREQRL